MRDFSQPDVRVFPDLRSLSRAAAGFFAVCAGKDVASRGRFTIALCGGATPKQLYRLLASHPYREAVPWRNTHVFWSDERCVPPDDPDSNYKLAFEAFLSSVPLPARQIHRIRGEEEPDRAAQAYEEELHRFFTSGPVFDLVLLGAGEDGHTASLFPGSTALHESNKLALPVHLDPPRPNRVTLTLPVMNNAERVLFLAAGRSKANMVHEIIEDGNPKGYPAGLVQPIRGRISWMLDQEAAMGLTWLFLKNKGNIR